MTRRFEQYSDYTPMLTTTTASATTSATDIRITIEKSPSSSEWEYEVWIDGMTVYGYEHGYSNACSAVEYVLGREGVSV